MRSPDKRLIVGLSVSTVIALVAVAAVSTASQAQFRTNSFSSGPRGGSMMSPSFRAEPRFQRFNNNAPDKIVTGGKGKGKSKGTDVSVTDRGTSDGGSGRRPPRDKRRPPHGPGIGPIIGTGVAIGTLGPTGPAGA